MNGPARQRAALACAALLGALSPLLPWAAVGVHTAPLTVDAAATGIVSGGFVVAAGLALAGDRSQPVRSSLPIAFALSLLAAGLLGFVARSAIVFARDGVDLGIGGYAAGVLAVFVGVGAWLGTRA